MTSGVGFVVTESEIQVFHVSRHVVGDSERDSIHGDFLWSRQDLKNCSYFWDRGSLRQHSLVQDRQLRGPLGVGYATARHKYFRFQLGVLECPVPAGGAGGSRAGGLLCVRYAYL
jgi:hypothetical protein